MEQFVIQNIQIIYFIYGLFFFIMGFTIAIQVRNFKGLINITLANKLWLLAAFGLVHGLAEWAVVFIPIHQQYLSQSVIMLLKTLELLIMAISFVFLFHFGIRLTNTKNHLIQNIPNILFAVWLGSYIFFYLFTNVSLSWLLVATEVWARYLLALPSSLICGLAFAYEWKKLKNGKRSKVANNYLASAVVFLFYALVAGLIVPQSSFFPAFYINTDTFLKVFKIPVQFLRMLSGGAMAYFILGILEEFRLVNQKQLEEIKMVKSVCEERERISRDLHDGIIQSIYAVGLSLEGVIHTNKQDINKANKQIKEVMGNLNKIIQDIRSYIMNLQPSNYREEDLVKVINNMLELYQANFGIIMDLIVEGKQNLLLTETQYYNIYHIIQEALTNIIKHSGATFVTVSLNFSNNNLLIRIKDNGTGFDTSVKNKIKKSGGHGLINMMQRAKMISAQINIVSSKDKGTEIQVFYEGGGNNKKN